MSMMRLRICVLATILSFSVAARSAALAADICAETVPATRFIDGVPAYAQCTASNTGAVYSNDGIATATTSGGAGWIRTQYSGGYQCTELAHRYLYFKWNVQSVPNGNAGVWCDGTIPNGLAKVATPVHGDLIVLAPGSCGADSMTGHVAVIDVVNADATVTAVQQNSASRSKYKLTCAACFLHAIANDGTATDAGVPSDGRGDTSPTDTGAGLTDAPAVMDSASGLDANGEGGAPFQSGSGGHVGSGGAPSAPGSGGTNPIATGGVTGSDGSGGANVPGTGGAPTPAGTGGAAPGAATDDPAGCACRLSAENGPPDVTPPWAPVALLAVGTVLTARRRRR